MIPKSFDHNLSINSICKLPTFTMSESTFESDEQDLANSMELFSQVPEGKKTLLQ